MVDFKDKIAEIIANKLEIEKEEIKNNIEKPKDNNMGDFAFPCFTLAKTLRKAPNIIAEELKNKIKEDDEGKKYISNVEAVNGFLNFSTNKEELIKSVIDEFSKKDEDYGKESREKLQSIIGISSKYKFLTVAKAMSEEAMSQVNTGSNLLMLIDHVIAAGEEMLVRTPEMLPVLKEFFSSYPPLFHYEPERI